MGERAKKMYKDSPRMGRGESGHMEVTRKKTEHEETKGGTAGTEEAIPHDVRHAHERHMMHAKHENEHAMADHKGEDKGEMHQRHEKEIEEMHKRHEGEKAGSDAGMAEAPAGE